MIDSLDVATPTAAALALIALAIGEAVVPMFALRNTTWRRRFRNLALAGINAALTSALFVGLTLAATEYGRAQGIGLLNVASWPMWAEWLIAFLILDLFHYAFHVAAHQIPALWRFHAVHHHDNDVDVTSALRFHVCEVSLQCALTIPVAVLCGLTMPQLLLYQLILLPVAMFHHANIRLPLLLDRVLRLIIVTPRMHWVHHSRWQPETNSNYASVLSWWDRIFGTMRLRPDPSTIDFGLDGYDQSDSDTLTGMLSTPFQPIKSEYGEAPHPSLLNRPEHPGGAPPLRKRHRRARDHSIERAEAG